MGTMREQAEVIPDYKSAAPSHNNGSVEMGQANAAEAFPSATLPMSTSSARTSERPTQATRTVMDGWNRSTDVERIRCWIMSNPVIHFTSTSWFPGCWDIENVEQEAAGAQQIHDNQQSRGRVVQRKRSIRRRIFLFLTEPDSSMLSALFFVILVLLIAFMNVLMILQTIPHFQYTPTECRSCGGDDIRSSSSRWWKFVAKDTDDDDDWMDSSSTTHTGTNECVCPPSPVEWSLIALGWTIHFFALELILRILSFEPPIVRMDAHHNPSIIRGSVYCTLEFWKQYFYFMISPSTLVDALAIFPYYIKQFGTSNGLLALQLFRVFQFVRLGKYNTTFKSFTSVVRKSIVHLKILIVILFFGALIFGSLIYWCERGTWKYYEPSGTYEYTRKNNVGEVEISPYSSIPKSFWWFIVTATTVGYGDMVPVTTLGHFVAVMAMLMGLLVIAYPVSVFSDLWSNELRMRGAIQDVYEDDNNSEEECKREEEGNTILFRQSADILLSASGYPTSVDREEGSQPGLIPDLQLLTLPDRIGESSCPRDTAGDAGRRDQLVSSSNATNGNCDEAGYSIEFDDNYIAINKNDIADIMYHLTSIDEPQRQIRAILRKYKYQNENLK